MSEKISLDSSVPEGERYDIIYECVHIVRLL